MKAEYRLIYSFPFYYVQKAKYIGWWVFKRKFWFTVSQAFWDLREAETRYMEFKCEMYD